MVAQVWSLLEVDLGPLLPNTEWVVLIPIAELILTVVAVALLIRLLTRK